MAWASAGFGASGSVRTTSTDVTSNRAVSQNVDTTTRQASDERRELVSHSTKVENILSLLNAKYVGTPFLSFSLNPRPLELLSLDPTDPNLWFSQLLARRSSGIEGLQEYTAVVVVPKDQDFCVSARLRRVCLLDVPPGRSPSIERYDNIPPQLVRMLNYVERTFHRARRSKNSMSKSFPPRAAGEIPAPSHRVWEIASIGGFLRAYLRRFPHPTGRHGVSTADVVYKHPLELWLDTLRDEYERDVARSPLERGVLLGKTHARYLLHLRGGRLAVSNSTASVTPLFPLKINPGDIDIGGVRGGALEPTRDVRARASRRHALERPRTSARHDIE